MAQLAELASVPALAALADEVALRLRVDFAECAHIFPSSPSFFFLSLYFALCLADVATLRLRVDFAECARPFSFFFFLSSLLLIAFFG